MTKMTKRTATTLMMMVSRRSKWEKTKSETPEALEINKKY